MSAYTYLIGWTAHDKWYYGYRGANKSSPEEDLWVRYFTSSPKVKEFRSLHGEPDVVRVHKVFDSGDLAKTFESKFLRRVKASRSARWLNVRANGGHKGYHSAESIAKMKANRVYKPTPDAVKAKISKTNRQRKIDGLRTHKNYPGKGKGKVFQEHSKAKMSAAAKAQAHVCPHCGKTGGNVLFRWHFDNCKQKDTKC